MNRSILFLCLGALALGSACSRQDAPDTANTPAEDSAAAGADDHQGMSDTAGADTGTMTGANDNVGGVNPNAAADDAFFRSAAEGGMAEVETGKLAQSKGSRAEVKSFGKMMVDDHSKANAELAAIATSAGATLPTELNAEHQAMKDKLSGLSGAAFDKEYIQGQIKDHEATLALMRTEIDSGQNAEAKAFAEKTLPTVEEHLKRIKEIAAKAGVEGEGG